MSKFNAMNVGVTVVVGMVDVALAYQQEKANIVHAQKVVNVVVAFVVMDFAHVIVLDVHVLPMVIVVMVIAI